MKGLRSALAIPILVVACATMGATPEPEHVTFEASYTVAPGANATIDNLTLHAAYQDCDAGIGCVRFPVRDDFRSFRLDVVDTTGAVVHATSATPGIPSICGETGENIPLYEGLDDIAFYVLPGTCEDGQTTSTPVTGTVVVTFTTGDEW